MKKSHRLHKDDHEVWRHVRSLTRRYAVLFGLELRAVYPTPRRQTKDRQGQCFKDGTIHITLRSAGSKRRDPAYRILETVAHELAHLQHFSHGRRWWNLYQCILSRMTADNCYPKLRTFYE